MTDSLLPQELQYNRFGDYDSGEIALREFEGEPSSDRTKELRKQFWDAKIALDIEFPYYYTVKWKSKEIRGLPRPLRRALALRHAFSNLTSVIRPGELLVMQKTRFARGAAPQVQFSEKNIWSAASKEVDADDLGASFDRVTILGRHGGNVPEDVGNVISVGRKFGIRKEDLPVLTWLCEYWDGRSAEDSALELERRVFGSYYELDMKIFQTVLASAPSITTNPDGRVTLDYRLPLELGIQGMMDYCQSRIAEQSIGKLDSEAIEKRIFWHAEIEVLEGLKAWVKNYAKEAERLGQIEESLEQKTEYEEIADILYWVSENTPRNFREALQLVWIWHLAVHMELVISGLSPGRLGQTLYPYFREDRDKGKLDRDKALELLECMRIKFSEIEICGGGGLHGKLSGNAFNNISVGGLKPDGTSAENELEELIIESAMTMATPSPTITVIYDPKLSERFMLKAVECVKTGTGYPAWVNNRVAMEFLLSQHGSDGMSLEEARSWGVAGCIEIAPAGSAFCVACRGFYSLEKLVELVLWDGVDPRTNIRVLPPPSRMETWDDFWEVFKQYLTETLTVWNAAENLNWVSHKQNITGLVLSALTRNCLETGADLDAGGAAYNATWASPVVAAVNAANSLASVKKLVFEEHAISMNELKEALRANFGRKSAIETERYSVFEQVKTESAWDDMLAMCQDAPKFGNDDPYVDQIYKNIVEYYTSVVRNISNFFGKPMAPLMLSVSSHGPLGQACLATPDGRLAGVTLADASVSAHPGTDLKGPYALLNSALCFDHSAFVNTQLNMKIHPRAIEGVQGAKKLLELIEAYMANGGYHIQFNIVDSRMLKDAQDHPEHYRNLLVRVAGFTEYWVEIGKPIQDEIIARTEYEKAG